MNDAINNLEKLSEALAKAANDPKHYNSPRSHYLEIMSWELHRKANELREIEDKFLIPISEMEVI